MTSNLITQFAEATEKVCVQLTKIIHIEQQKRDALLHYDIDATEKLMKSQQALVMQLENMEKRRCAEQVAAGFSTLTSTEVLKCLSPEDRLILSPLFDKMHLATGELKLLNKVSLDIVTAELRLMSRTTPSSQMDSRYQANGKKTGSSFGESSFREKI